jgi:hypothetical protein
VVSAVGLRSRERSRRVDAFGHRAVDPFHDLGSNIVTHSRDSRKD